MFNMEKKAFAVVQNNRYNAQKKLEQTLEKLRADDEFARLEIERDTLAFQLAKNSAQKKDTKDIASTLKKTTDKLLTRVNALGYNASDIEISYVCNICKDTGMVGAENCKCIENHIFELLRQQNNMLITDIDDFDKLNLDIISADKRQDYQKYNNWLKKYGEQFPSVKYKVVGLFGAVGSGKTFALSVLANSVMKKGYSVYMLNSQQLNRLFLRYHIAPIEQKDSIFAPLLHADLLIIDDLGAENIMNNVTVNYLYMLLMERSTQPIALSSNLTLEALMDRYGQRIFSRLADKSRCIHLRYDGDDLRFAQAN